MPDSLAGTEPDADEASRLGALAIAQFSAFSKQIPLLYFILLANSWTVSINMMEAAPAVLTVYIPIAVTVLCAVRLLKWVRNAKLRPDGEAARKALRTTQFLAVLLSVSSWPGRWRFFPMAMPIRSATSPSSWR